MADLLRTTSGQEIGASGTSADTPEDVFERYPLAQFTLAGLTIAFPVITIQESGGNRIAERERPYRDGAKLDDIGSKAKRWTLEAIFNNSLIIKDLESINAGIPLYPDALNLLISIFDIHETGDLVVPTVGPQRCRAESYSRVESMEGRDQSIVQFVFCEDNEDDVDFRSISAPTGGANGRRLGNTTELDTQSFGSWSDSLLEVQSFLLDLEDLVNAPGNVALDIEAAAQRIEGSSRRAERTFSEAGRPGRDLFLDPANSRGPRKLAKAIDLAARERDKARRGRPQVTSIVMRDSTSLFRVAAVVGQDPADLISINPNLDPNFIPANTPVKVLVTEALLNGSSSAS